MLQRLHNLVRHPVEIDRGAGPDAVESAHRDVLERAQPSFDGSHPHDVASVMTLTFPSPRPSAEGRLHSTGGIAAHPHSLEDPCGPFRPIEGSKPQPTVSSRSNAASKEVLAIDHSPASRLTRPHSALASDYCFARKAAARSARPRCMESDSNRPLLVSTGCGGDAPIKEIAGRSAAGHVTSRRRPVSTS